MGDIILVVVIAFAVFQVILLLKIWRMTEDVKAIRRSVVKTSANNDSIHDVVVKYKMLGKPENAINELNNRLESELNRIMLRYRFIVDHQTKWENVLAEYKPLYEYLGAVIPEAYLKFNFVDHITKVTEIRGY